MKSAERNFFDSINSVIDEIISKSYTEYKLGGTEKKASFNNYQPEADQPSAEKFKIENTKSILM